MEWRGHGIEFPDGAYARSYRAAPSPQTAPPVLPFTVAIARPSRLTDSLGCAPPPLCTNQHPCVWTLGPSRSQCGKCCVRLMTPGPRWRCDGCGWDFCLLCAPASGDAAKLVAMPSDLPPASPSPALAQYTNAPPTKGVLLESRSVPVSVYANVAPQRSVPTTPSINLYGPHDADGADATDRDLRIAITMAVAQPASAAAVYGNVEAEPRTAIVALTPPNSQPTVDAKPPAPAYAASATPAQARGVIPAPHVPLAVEALVRARELGRTHTYNTCLFYGLIYLFVRKYSPL